MIERNRELCWEWKNGNDQIGKLHTNATQIHYHDIICDFELLKSVMVPKTFLNIYFGNGVIY